MIERRPIAVRRVSLILLGLTILMIFAPVRARELTSIGADPMGNVNALGYESRWSVANPTLKLTKGETAIGQVMIAEQVAVLTRGREDRLYLALCLGLPGALLLGMTRKGPHVGGTYSV